MSTANNPITKYVKACIVLCSLYLISPMTFAGVIETKMPNGMIAKAEYAQEDLSQPAILILHGFLQTHSANTIIQLSSHLTTEGFSVLAPSLTLGINKRKQSLSCEAIHTHSMDDDINEIEFWINWLKSKGFKDIYIIGHSYGSLHSIIYSSKKYDPIVRKLIATSLVDNEHGVGKELHKKQLMNVNNKVSNNDFSLEKYKISFCKEYVSPPKEFLSYAKWNQNEIIKLLNNVKTPVHIILGSNDKRIDKNWPNRLKKAGAKLTLIDGANHFFAAEYEFDLADSVISLINNE